MNIKSDASLVQIRAADPNNSTWVSANAGSGKTRVLTDRVARLLLAGTKPQKILCLTYTKAAAAEMQTRLFKRLGSWAMMEDDELQLALADLSDDETLTTKSDLRSARRLFAAALETPGGLKIQTIHSFCDAILRQFPLEAGVSPQFQLLEDSKAAQMRAEILDQMATNEMGPLSEMARFFTDLDPDPLLAAISKKRMNFRARPQKADFDLSGNEGRHSAQLKALSAVDPDKFDALADAIGTNPQGNAVGFMKFYDKWEVAQTEAEYFEALKRYFVTSSGTPRVRFPAKNILSKVDEDLKQELIDLAIEVFEAHSTLASITAYESAQALFDFAPAFLGKYAEAKEALALVDYDDLIQRALSLLQTDGISDWVLYRLDGGIDHILVDEAQDTSPEQWDIITTLAREFTSGVSANETDRTIFVVGDDKQSIYSFQGADPAEFVNRRQYFSERLKDVNQWLNNVKLSYSFRSSAPVLRLVDWVLEQNEATYDQGLITHLPFHTDLPGKVEIWPFIEGVKDATEDKEWYEPLDKPSAADPRLELAQKIADWAKGAIGKDLLPFKTKEGDIAWRRMRAGDILILVQKRGRIYQAVMAALKAANLNVAGADRLKLADDLPIKDLVSLLKFSLLPEDDLSLAEALRSPLCGLSEAELFDLAYDRKGSLWESFRKVQDQFPKVKELLWAVLNNSGFMRPFELLELILVQHKGRENLMARLGTETEDAIEAFLDQALIYESTEAPTLTGFLDWFETGQSEIKRQMDGEMNQIRVMTVHGAKGLEAPVVILPDTAKQKDDVRDKLFDLDIGKVGWRVPKTMASQAQTRVDEITKEKDSFERNRLLYVALTRAETRLVICGAGEKPNEKTWYHKIETAMGDEGVSDDLTGGRILEYLWSPNTPVEDLDQEVLNPEIPDYLRTNAPSPQRGQSTTISPSKLDGPKALPSDTGISEEEAMKRGSQIHFLLEHLPKIPQEKWLSFAQASLEAVDDFEDVFGEASNVLNTPNLQRLFSTVTLSEVAITAPSKAHGNQKIDGVIDKLIIDGDRIIVVDFKSNSMIPSSPHEVPRGVLAQMGAYLVALEQVYPEHSIDLQILWTKDASIMSIPHDIVREPFNTATIS